MRRHNGQFRTRHEALTDRLLKMRDCRTCMHTRVNQRGGARVCVVEGAPNPSDVIVGRVYCEFYK